MADIDKLVEELSKLSVLEAAELVKKLEENWGVSAAAPVAMAAAAGGAPAAAAEPVEEKTEFDVVIKDAGPKKIEVIKTIRQLTNLGLKEAKDVAETAGSKILEAVSKEAATMPRPSSKQLALSSKFFNTSTCCPTIERGLFDQHHQTAPFRKDHHRWPFYFS